MQRCEGRLYCRWMAPCMAPSEARDLPGVGGICHIRVALVVRGQTHRCRGSWQAQRALRACVHVHAGPGRAGQRSHIRQYGQVREKHTHTHTHSCRACPGWVCVLEDNVLQHASVCVSHHITASYPPAAAAVQQPLPYLSVTMQDDAQRGERIGRRQRPRHASACACGGRPRGAACWAAAGTRALLAPCRACVWGRPHGTTAACHCPARGVRSTGRIPPGAPYRGRGRGRCAACTPCVCIPVLTDTATHTASLLGHIAGHNAGGHSMARGACKRAAHALSAVHGAAILARYAVAMLASAVSRGGSRRRWHEALAVGLGWRGAASPMAGMPSRRSHSLCCCSSGPPMPATICVVSCRTPIAASATCTHSTEGLGACAVAEAAAVLAAGTGRGGMAANAVGALQRAQRQAGGLGDGPSEGGAVGGAQPLMAAHAARLMPYPCCACACWSSQRGREVAAVMAAVPGHLCFALR